MQCALCSAKDDDVCEVMSNPSMRKVKRIEYFENSDILASLDTQENRIKHHATLDDIDNCFSMPSQCRCKS